jgi:hypothetical protein
MLEEVLVKIKEGFFLELDQERFLKYVFFLFVFIKLLLLVNYSLSREFIMDEFSQAYKARLLEDFYSSYIPIKNVLYAYFYNIPNWFVGGSVGIAISSRFLSLAAMLGVVYLVYVNSKLLSLSKVGGLVAVCLTLSVTTFMEHGFRIRSETIAILFTNIALCFLLKGAKNSDIKYSVWAGVFIALGFLCTQKAIFFVLAYGIAVVVCDRQYRKNITQACIMGAGFCCTVFLYALYFDFSDPARVILIMLYQPVDLVANAGGHYQNLREFIVRTITRNQILYGLYLASVFFSLFSYSSLSKAERIAVISSILLGFMVFLYDQPWPYIFVFVVPIFSVVCSVFVRECLQYTKHIYLLLIPLFLGIPNNYLYSKVDNNFQFATISKAESLLGTEEVYADGIGMILSRDRSAPDIGLDKMTRDRIYRDWETGGVEKIDALFDGNPKLWIDSYRLNPLWKIVGKRFEQSYVRISPNILLAGQCYGAHENIEYENFWVGEYSFYSSSGEPLALDASRNGISLGESFELGRGQHRIEREDSGRVCLFPAELSLVPLRVYSRRIPLFLHAYD